MTTSLMKALILFAVLLFFASVCFAQDNCNCEQAMKQIIQKIETKSPKQVVILANRRTASSGEAFLMDARQSKKVKILGTPTYGALDYGSASIFSFGCKNYKLMMPTRRSMRLPDYPIDNIGIRPDIYLDKPVKDRIRFAEHYHENK